MLDSARAVIEEVLSQILSEALGKRPRSISEQFVLPQGDETSISRITSLIREMFRIELPRSAIAGESTVVKMADSIEEMIRHGPILGNATIPRIPRGGPLPLSISQERIWFLEKLDPTSNAHNNSLMLRISGKLDRSALEESLVGILRRHESLRTEFVVADGRPAQIIRSTMAAKMSTYDFADRPETEGEKAASELLEREANKPFDLDRGPLFRFNLCRIREASNIFGITMHQIVSDSWSLRVFLHDLEFLYNAKVENKPTELPAPLAQSVDIASWQRNRLQGNLLEAQMAYWRNRLSMTPTLGLHADNERVGAIPYGRAFVSREIRADLLDEIRRLSESEGVTTFMALFATLLVLLHRYTGQDDIAVGVPTSNRLWRDLWNVVTSIEHLLVLRTDLSGRPDFLELLRRVHETAVQAFMHQDVPFAKLVTELKVDWDPNQAPLVQAKFHYMDSSIRQLRLKDLEVSFREFHRGSPPLDVSLAISEIDGRRRIRFEYNTSVFEEDTIVRMMNHYENLLRSAVMTPRKPIAELSMLDTEERLQLLNSGNSSIRADAEESPVQKLFENQAQRTPEAIAVVSMSLIDRAEEQLTYRELNRRADHLALFLHFSGVEQGMRVGVFIERTTEMLVGLLGIMKAGGTFVPLDPELPAERVSFIITDAAVEVVVTQKDLAPRLPPGIIRPLCMDGGWNATLKEWKAAVPGGASPADLAYIMYTSGSTGSPKGIAISHRSLANFLVSMQYQPGIRASDTMLATTTISFDPSTLELFLPIIIGGKIILEQKGTSIDGALLTKEIERTDATILQATPSRYRMLLESGWQGHSRVKLLCGGERLTQEMAERLLEHGSSLWNMYGPTETTVWSSVSEVRRGDSHIGIGRPIANMNYFILDRELQPAPAGVPGELCICGVGLSPGYLNDPTLTAAKFVSFSPDGVRFERLYRSGDIVRRGLEGKIEYLGRLDDQVKVRGCRIEPQEIEAVLAEHSGIRASAVVVGGVDPDDLRLVANVLLTPSNPPTEKQIRGYMKERLPGYMLPSAYVFLEELPLTNTGKIDRKALSVLAAVRPAAKEPSAIRLKGPLEMQLTNLWEELLGKHPIGSNESFFDIGGHSLLAIRLLAKIEKTMKIRLPVDTIFRTPTISELAEVIQRNASDSIHSLLVPIQPHGSKEPFFCVHDILGNVLGFQELSLLLGPEQPFYALRARGLNAGENPHTAIPEMSSDCIKAIQSVCPEGPYFVGGYSFGGIVAFEIAQQLTAQGKQVGLLAIFDEFAPPRKGTRRERMKLAALQNMLSNFPYWIKDFKVWKDENFSSSIWPRLRRSWNRMTGMADRSVSGAVIENLLSIDRNLREEQRQVLEANIKAYGRYRPRKYPGEVVLFRTRALPLLKSQDPAMGWEWFADGGVEIRKVAGNHINILRAPLVDSLVRQLQPFLNLD